MLTIRSLAATRQLANQQYGVCIQARAGYCSIKWTKPTAAGQYYFTVTEDPLANGPSIPGWYT